MKVLIVIYTGPYIYISRRLRSNYNIFQQRINVNCNMKTWSRILIFVWIPSFDTNFISKNWKLFVIDFINWIPLHNWDQKDMYHIEIPIQLLFVCKYFWEFFFCFHKDFRLCLTLWEIRELKSIFQNVFGWQWKVEGKLLFLSFSKWNAKSNLFFFFLMKNANVIFCGGWLRKLIFPSLQYSIQSNKKKVGQESWFTFPQTWESLIERSNRYWIVTPKQMIYLWFT